MKKYLMLPLVSVFFFISVPSVSALEFCEEKTGNFYYNNGVENKACNSFNDLEVCEYSLGKGRKYASGSSEQFKKEARKRNLSNTDCRVMAGLESKNTPKLAETKIVEEKKVVSSYDREEFCEQIGEPDNVSWVGGSYYVSGDQCKEGWTLTTKANYCKNAPSDYSGFKKFCSLDKQDEKNVATYNDIASDLWNVVPRTICLRATKIDGSDWRGSNSMDYIYVKEAQRRNIELATCNVLADRGNSVVASSYKKIPNTLNEETKKQLVTPIIKPEPEVTTTNEEMMVASAAVEPQLARIGEAEFGFKCEWMHWNSKGSASYNACIDTYVNADKAEQEELRLAKVEAENQAQQAKLLEDKMNELDRMYGATCKAMGLSKKDDEFPKCMMEMMKIEQEKEQAKIQNEIAMAQIQLQQAQLEAQNKAMDLRLAELEKNNELIREANIRSQKAEAERTRQQQVLLKKQIALQEKKDKQQGWMNALMALNALQPKQPSVGFIQTMPTRTVCSWQYGQYVCNTR